MVGVGTASDLESLSFPGVDRKGPFCQPVTGRKLSDTFGAPRGGGRKHEGIDIFAPEGTPIHAISGGTVVQGFSNGLGGNVVRIQGDDGRYYYYAHMKSGTFDHLKVGEHVNAGQVIGGVGHTGDAATTPNHLHLQVRENGDWINPFKFIQPLPDLPEAMGTASAIDSVDPFAIDHGSPPSVADTDHDGLIDQFEGLFGTDPNLSDTDHDGLSDAFETGQSHTDPLSADTDKDGLTDAYEIGQGSDPGQAKVPDAVQAAHFGGLASLDSDADGLSDAFEQKAGTDPLAADSDKDGLSDGDEIARKSNPLSLDSDNDGLSDGFEAAQGTLEPVAQEDPLGQDPLGQGALGQSPLGQDSLGQGSLGQDSLSQDALTHGTDPPGDHPFGDDAIDDYGSDGH